MTETVISIKALPEILSKLIKTEKVRIKEDGGNISIEPIEESIDYIDKLRGSLSAHPDMTVDKFLERMRADKELEL